MTTQITLLQVNLDMTDSMGPGKLVRHMQNPSYTYDEYLICIGLGPSISSVICKNPSYSGPSYPSSPVFVFYTLIIILLWSSWVRCWCRSAGWTRAWRPQHIMGSYLTTSTAQLFQLSKQSSEIELITNAVAGAFLLHNFAFSIKILHAQCTISPLELSPSRRYVQP